MTQGALERYHPEAAVHNFSPRISSSTLKWPPSKRNGHYTPRKINISSEKGPFWIQRTFHGTQTSIFRGWYSFVSRGEENQSSAQTATELEEPSVSDITTPHGYHRNPQEDAGMGTWRVRVTKVIREDLSQNIRENGLPNISKGSPVIQVGNI